MHVIIKPKLSKFSDTNIQMSYFGVFHMDIDSEISKKKILPFKNFIKVTIFVFKSSYEYFLNVALFVFRLSYILTEV